MTILIFFSLQIPLFPIYVYFFRGVTDHFNRVNDKILLKKLTDTSQSSTLYTSLNFKISQLVRDSCFYLKITVVDINFWYIKIIISQFLLQDDWYAHHFVNPIKCKY